MTTRVLFVLVFALAATACDPKTVQKGTGATTSAVSVTGAPSAVCVTAMPASLGVDASGPHLLFTAVAGNLTLEEQENGVWARLDAKLTMRPGNVIDYHVHYDHSYRIAVTQAGCAQSPWLLMVTGPINPDGSGGTPPTPGPTQTRWEQCTDYVFTRDDPTVVTFVFDDVHSTRATFITYDKNPDHWKQGQKNERLWIASQAPRLMLITGDIPEDKDHATAFDSFVANGRVEFTLWHTGLGEGPESVHGACIVLEK